MPAMMVKGVELPGGGVHQPTKPHCLSSLPAALALLHQ